MAVKIQTETLPRQLDRHRETAVTSLIPSLSCRLWRPDPPFAELVRLSPTSIADEIREEQGHGSWKQ
jgi:hypothetical protein